MLPLYGAMVTDEASPIYRYGKRAYFIIDKDGVVRTMKIQTNPLDLLNPDEVLKALKTPGSVKHWPAAVSRAGAALPSWQRARRISRR